MKKRHALATAVAIVLLAGVALAGAGDWKQVGKSGAWKNTLAGVAGGDKIYTVEIGGALYVTDPADGTWKKLGKDDFAKTRFMFHCSGALYTIESDGNLYKVSPADGTWKQIGKDGAWKNTITGVAMKNKIYTVETNGKLYETDPATGAWKQIGKPDFANTRFMLKCRGTLLTIETDGNLYRVNPADGTWKKIGKDGAWKKTTTGTSRGGKIYTTETDGNLYETDPQTGVWKKLGKSEFGNTKFIFAARGNLYSIETDGNLYEIYVK